jgi:hypothetical protein
MEWTTTFSRVNSPSIGGSPEGGPSEGPCQDAEFLSVWSNSGFLVGFLWGSSAAAGSADTLAGKVSDTG